MNMVYTQKHLSLLFNICNSFFCYIVLKVCQRYLQFLFRYVSSFITFSSPEATFFIGNSSKVSDVDFLGKGSTKILSFNIINSPKNNLDAVLPFLLNFAASSLLLQLKGNFKNMAQYNHSQHLITKINKEKRTHTGQSVELWVYIVIYMNYLYQIAFKESQDVDNFQFRNNFSRHNE